MIRTTVLALLISAFTGLSASAGDTWPEFRGIGDSVTDARSLPVTWSETENIAWKADLPGYGQSAPVVWKDKVFVTAVAGEERDKGFVLAFDAITGKKLWQYDFQPTQKARWSFSISKAAPTPAVDSKNLYAFFEGGDVLALSHDGKLLWRRSLVKDYGEFQNNHGLAASLALTDDAAIVLVDDRGPSYMIALDKATGKNIWKQDRPQRGSWSSPVMSPDRKEIIVSSNGSLAAYNAKTGDRLWMMEGLSGNTIPSAVLAGDRIIVGAGASKGDIKAATQSNCCVKRVSKDGSTAGEIVWRSNKAVASYASPLVHRGHVYFVNSSGVAFCLDLATGEELYAERIDGPCWATPIAAGDHIYFFGKSGVTTVVKAGPAFEKVASNTLWSEGAKAKTEDAGPYSSSRTSLYGVAAVDGAFFVRSGPTLYRIGRSK